LSASLRSLEAQVESSQQFVEKLKVELEKARSKLDLESSEHKAAQQTVRLKTDQLESEKVHSNSLLISKVESFDREI